MMHDMGDWHFGIGHWGFGLLFWGIVILAVAALIKYLFFGQRR